MVCPQFKIRLLWKLECIFFLNDNHATELTFFSALVQVGHGACSVAEKVGLVFPSLYCIFKSYKNDQSTSQKHSEKFL